MCTLAPALSWEMGRTEDVPTVGRGPAGDGVATTDDPRDSLGVNVRIRGLGIAVVGSSTSSMVPTTRWLVRPTAADGDRDSKSS
jgi:hypothetical protein